MADKAPSKADQLRALRESKHASSSDQSPKSSVRPSDPERRDRRLHAPRPDQAQPEPQVEVRPDVSRGPGPKPIGSTSSVRPKAGRPKKPDTEPLSRAT